MTHMHVGSFDPNTIRALLQFSSAEVIVDGDSWEEWGEEPIAGHPHHVVIQHRDGPYLLTLLAGMLGDAPAALIPMAYHRQRGILACITDGDWSEPIHEVLDTQARRFLARNPTTSANDSATDMTVWQDVAWLEYLYLRSEDSKTNHEGNHPA